jgi:UDP-N-acetylmuramate dehydrogenase
MRKSLHFKKKFNLKEYNTFGLNVNCRYFIPLEDPEILPCLKESPEWLDNAHLILGEGSNILFLSDFDGLVLHPCNRGITIKSEDEKHIYVTVAAGEKWDFFVEWCVAKGFGGIENLSLIPGLVGSAPVQNIGAYGVEIAERIVSVKGFDFSRQEFRNYEGTECEFGYRSSIFKTTLKDRFLITEVTFRLDKHPLFVLNYGPVEKEFNRKSKQDLANLRQTIIEIRESKLPDPLNTGNAGSFFKNPLISRELFLQLIHEYPQMPNFPAGDQFKIPAAWLIERSGWKGVRENAVGTWPSQPLVIVNYGGAGGKEIYGFSEKIREAVYKKFRIRIEREVNVI